MSQSSIQNVIARVMKELKINNSDDISWLEVESNEYCRQFNIKETYLKQQCNDLQIDSNFNIALPNDFYKMGVLGTQFNPYPTAVPPTNPPIQPQFKAPFSMFYYDHDCLDSCGYDCNGFNGYRVGTYQIIGDHIHLSGNLGDASCWTPISLCYLAYNTDEFGTFRIPIEMENAIFFEITHRYMMRDDTSKYLPYRMQWFAAKSEAMFAKVTGDSNTKDFVNKIPQIADVVNAILVNKPLSGNGIGNFGFGV